MKFKDLEIGDTFKSTRYQHLIFTKVQEVSRTCCKPGYNSKGIGHSTNVLFAQEDEVEKIETQS